MTKDDILAKLKRAIKEGKLTVDNLTTENLAKAMGISTAEARLAMIRMAGSVEAFWKLVGAGRDR